MSNAPLPRIPSQWPSIILLIAILVAIVALAALGDEEVTRSLVGVLIGLLIPSPISGMLSESRRPAPAVVAVEPREMRRTEPNQTEDDPYDQ